MAQNLGITDGPADAERQRSDQPQALVDHQVEGLQLVQRVDVERAVTDPITLLAAALLPVRVGGQVVGHGGECRGGRIVRGHHQKNHVVDDVGVAEGVSVIICGVA